MPKHMHANWCFQSKCSNISAEGLHFSAFHINSLTFIPLSDSTRLILYADDLLIYKPILTETSHLQLQSDINSISLCGLITIL